MFNRVSGASDRIAAKARTAIDDPEGAWRFVRGNVHMNTLVRLVNGYESYGTSTLLDEDWDVAVVLDACRYDLLAAANPFNLPCEERTSVATNTNDWFQRTFGDAQRTDTDDIVYIAPKPLTVETGVDEERFRHYEPVYEYGRTTDIDTVPSGWPTTPADIVTEAAIDLHEEYPENRLVVHYLQPHAPFVQDAAGNPPESVGNLYSDIDRKALTYETIPNESIKAAFEHNLDYVLEYVRALRDQVSGEMIVTADHGDAFGEYRLYGHPSWGTIDPILKVPLVRVFDE